MIPITPEYQQRAFVDRVYDDSVEGDPLDVLPMLFEALRTQVSFASGTYVRFDPLDWTVSVPYMHEIEAEVVRGISERYCRLNPYRIHLPHLKHPNEVVRMSDFVDVKQVFRGEFGEAMRLVGCFHCMAMVPLVRGMPLGAFSVHRPGTSTDFAEEEQAAFRWFVGHAAKAIDYRRALARLRRPDPAALVISPAQRRVVALTEEAQLLLARAGDSDPLPLPACSGDLQVWSISGKAYAVHRIALHSESLLNSSETADLSFIPSSRLTEARLRFAPADTAARALVLLDRLDAAELARERLAALGLSRRKEQVALLMVLGKGTKEIARTCGISLNTAKEYVADVYQRLDVHSRTAFLRRVTVAEEAARLPGRAGALPPARLH